MRNSVNSGFWSDKRVFLTGHTGFKGSWLAFWLLEMGADVYGYALAPQTDRDLYHLLDLERHMHSTIADLEDTDGLRCAMREADPDIVFHLAAQPLVRLSYEKPLVTMATNIMGTAHVLDGLRGLERGGAAIIVTSDKCYQNLEVLRPYREDDPMGGRDPYSMSKGCAELVVASFRDSYFADGPWCVASARSGNVFGGGDWGLNRIIPDYFRAFESGDALKIRQPQAIRPWLYVMDTLTGYLMLAESCFGKEGDSVTEGWNYGPDNGAIKTVGGLIDAFNRILVDPPVVEFDDATHPHEAKLLCLDSAKVRSRLGWSPVFSFNEGLVHTASWYKAFFDGEDMRAFCCQQLREYRIALSKPH